MLGTDDPVPLQLARRAAVLSACAVAVVMRDLSPCLSAAHGVGRRGRPRVANAAARAIQGLLVRAAGRQPAPRAAAEFYTATIARVDRQRFVLAIAVGLALAWACPACAHHRRRNPRRRFSHSHSQP